MLLQKKRKEKKHHNNFFYPYTARMNIFVSIRNKKKTDLKRTSPTHTHRNEAKIKRYFFVAVYSTAC